MGYVEQTLTAEERILYRAKLSWIAFFWNTPFFLLAAIVAFAMGNEIFGGIFIAITLLDVIFGLIAYFTSEFSLTNKRVILKQFTTSVKLSLIEVEEFGVNQGILGKILDNGNILVSGTGGTRKTFVRISAPLEFHKRVHKQIEIAQESKSMKTAKVTGEATECPQCGKTNRRTANFCGSCGADMQSAREAAQGLTSLPCPKCSAENNPEAKFCQGCGSPLSPAK